MLKNKNFWIAVITILSYLLGIGTIPIIDLFKTETTVTAGPVVENNPCLITVDTCLTKSDTTVMLVKQDTVWKKTPKPKHTLIKQIMLDTNDVVIASVEHQDPVTAIDSNYNKVFNKNLWTWIVKDSISTVEASGIIYGEMTDFQYRISLNNITNYVETTKYEKINVPVVRKIWTTSIHGKLFFEQATQRLRPAIGLDFTTPNGKRYSGFVGGSGKDVFYGVEIGLPLFRVKQ